MGSVFRILLGGVKCHSLTLSPTKSDRLYYLHFSSFSERFTSNSAETKSHSSESQPFQQIYHGLISEDAQPGDEVELDAAILARDRTALIGGELFWEHSQF